MSMSWDPVGKVAARGYRWKRRFFIEFAGMVPLQLMHDTKGISWIVVPNGWSAGFPSENRVNGFVLMFSSSGNLFTRA